MARIVGVMGCAAFLVVGGMACSPSKPAKVEKKEVAETPTYEFEDEEPEDIEVEEAGPAVINGVVLQPEVIRAGDQVSADVSAPDDISVRYLWKLNDREFPLQSGPVLRASLKRGDSVMVTVVPSRAGVEGRTSESALYVVQNSAPVYVGSIGGGFQLNGHQFKVMDPDGDALSFSLSGQPPGLDIDSTTGVLSWAGENDGSESAYEVVMTASDPDGAEVSVTFPVRITGG